MADRAASRRRREKGVQALRRAIVGAVALLVVVVGGIGLYYGTGLRVGDAAEGQHYQRLASGAEATTGPVEVVEYFSYACVHCWNFDPMVEAFGETLPRGAVLRRAHVRYNSALEILARAHAALMLHGGAATANHERIFRAIHDRQRQFTTAEAIADYVDGHGIDRDAFLALMTSPRVARRVAEDDAAAQAAGVVAVPALVVANKYAINMNVGRKQALAVAEELVRRELTERQGGGAGDA